MELFTFFLRGDGFLGFSQIQNVFRCSAVIDSARVSAAITVSFRPEHN